METEIIPASHWQSNGHSDNNVQEVETFIEQLRYQTDQFENKEFLGGIVSVGLVNWNLEHDQSFQPFWERFARALENYQNDRKDIVKFSVMGIHLPKKILNLLSLALRKKELTTLRFWKNNLGKDGYLFVVDKVKMNPTLKKLTLDSNPIDDLYVATQLSQALREHQKLEIISLENCELGFHGSDILSVILDATRNMKQVQLAGNRLGLCGGITLSNCLVRNPHLIQLHLGHSGLNDEAAKHLADSLKKNTTLKWLDVSNNEDVTSVGKGAFCNAVFDTTNLNSIATSNHTCIIYDCEEENGSHIGRIFGMNRDHTAEQNKTKKIFTILRVNKEKVLNLELFNDILFKLIPYTLEFLQRDLSKEKCLSNIFEMFCFKVPY